MEVDAFQRRIFSKKILLWQLLIDCLKNNVQHFRLQLWNYFLQPIMMRTAGMEQNMRSTVYSKGIAVFNYVYQNSFH
jgi:hypothetical protein